MKLYDYAAAPNPRRVHIFLAEKGIEIPIEKIDLRERQNVGAEYLGINPFGTVPMLELDDGTHITESIAICRYFEALQPEPPLMGTTPEEQALIEMWQRRVELNGLVPAGEAFRNAEPGFKDRALAGPGKTPQIAELAERGRNRVTKFFEYLDKTLAESDYIAGDRFSIADITGFVLIGFAGWSKLAPEESQTNLKAWYERMNERPSMRS